jgi:hypothetical protein
MNSVRSTSSQDVEHENYNLTGNFVRLTVQDMGQGDLLDMQRKIQKEHKPLTVDVKQTDEKSVQRDSTVVEDAKAVLQDIRTMLKRYIDDQCPAGLDAAHLLAAGEKCLDEITLS